MTQPTHTAPTFDVEEYRERLTDELDYTVSEIRKAGADSGWARHLASRRQGIDLALSHLDEMTQVRP